MRTKFFPLVGLVFLGAMISTPLAPAQDAPASASAQPVFRSALVAGDEGGQSLSQQLIVDLEKKLWRAYQEQARKPFDAAVEKLDLQYGVAVERELAASKRSAVQLAVKVELKLIASGESPIDAEGEARPSPVEEIRKLRGMYSDRYKQLVMQRAENTKPLLATFVRELSKLQKELELGEAQSEVAMLEELRARLPSDSGSRELAQILQKPESPVAEAVAAAGPREEQPPGDDTRGEGGPAPAGLPRTAKQLERYLKHTVWEVETVKGAPDGKFYFRGDGRMSMPWHSVPWRVLDDRSVMMDNKGSWQFRLDFSKDMKTVTARGSAGKGKDGWDGTFSKRITSALGTSELEQIVGSRIWKLTTDEGEAGSIEFGPRLVKTESSDLPWKKWEVLDGILVVSDTKKVLSEFFLESADKPYRLKGLTSKQSDWRLEEVGDE